MFSPRSFGRVCLLAGSVIVTAALAACADPTAPSTRQLHAPNAAAHDDSPPDLVCRSGWIVIDGRWTCPD
jgi:hypothetical protein